MRKPGRDSHLCILKEGQVVLYCLECSSRYAIKRKEAGKINRKDQGRLYAKSLLCKGFVDFIQKVIEIY